MITSTAESPESTTIQEGWLSQRTRRTAISAGASAFCAAVLIVAPKMILSSNEPLRFTGAPGGPFSPVSAGRSIHSGVFPVAWRLTGVPTWIDATEQGGILSMSSEKPIQLRPNAAAARLQPGIYQAEIGVVSSSISVVPAVPVVLEVKPPGSGRPEFFRGGQRQLGKSIENIPCAASVGRWKDYDVLSGFVDSVETLDRIRQVADAVPRILLGDIAVIGARPCAIVRSVRKMLFATPAPAIDIGPSDVFREGDVLKIEIHAPDSARYLEAFYLQADGTVRRLTADDGMLAPAHDTLVFGDGMNGRSKFTVGAPFGQEMILALASNDPIFFGPDVSAAHSSNELLKALNNAFPGDAAVAAAGRFVSARVKFLSVRGR
jgi:hypothetical protein